MPTTAEVAADFTAMLREGRFEEAGERYWSQDVVSIEPMAMGDMPAETRGLEALRAKGAWWYANNTVVEFAAAGPYVHGDQFALAFTMKIQPKPIGEVGGGDEIGLYTVRDGRIVEERFFY